MDLLLSTVYNEENPERPRAQAKSQIAAQSAAYFLNLGLTPHRRASYSHCRCPNQVDTIPCFSLFTSSFRICL